MRPEAPKIAFPSIWRYLELRAVRSSGDNGRIRGRKSLARKRNPPRETGIENDRPLKEIIDELFPDHVVAEIAAQFSIEIDRLMLTKALRDIARRYIVANRLSGLDAVRKSDRLEYSAREKRIAEFKMAFQGWMDDDIAGDMAFAARITDAPLPTTDFPHLSNHQRQRNEAYCHELFRLLELARKSQQLVAERLTAKGGRPINYGLEGLTRHAADFWIEILHRPFTLDHHQGGGLTDAFEFVQSLVRAIDKIPDTAIVTAMRAEIKSRRSLGVSNKPI